MIKLMASDIDGTLLNENHTTDDFMSDTVRMVKKSGRIFAVAVGRFFRLHEINRPRLNSVYRISMNGTVVKDIKSKVLYSKPIPKEFINSFVELIKVADVDYCGDEYTYSSMSLQRKIDKFKIKGFKGAAGNPSRIRDFFMDYRFDIDKEEIKKLNIYKINTNASDEETVTIEIIDENLKQNGYENDFSDKRMYHEIYLSDPRKAAPEKMKTVIRHPIRKI